LEKNINQRYRRSIRRCSSTRNDRVCHLQVKKLIIKFTLRLIQAENLSLDICLSISKDRCFEFFIFSGRRSDQPDHVLYHIDNEQPLGSKSPSREEIELSSPILRSIPKKRQKLDLNNLNTYKILQPHSSVPPPGVE